MFKRLSIILGYLVDVRVDKWISSSSLKKSYSRTFSIAKSLIPLKANPPNDKRESFEEACLRLSLSSEDLSKKRLFFNWMSFLFLIFGFFLVFYCISFLKKRAFINAMTTLLLTLYTFVQSFYYYFLAFQIKNRKLGYRIKDWLQQINKPF